MALIAEGEGEGKREGAGAGKQDQGPAEDSLDTTRSIEAETGRQRPNTHIYLHTTLA